MGVYHKADATVSAKRAVAVTTSDSTVIETTRALYIGTGGNITVRMATSVNDAGSDTANVLFSNVPAGIFPIQVDMVLATGTTASNIVALY